MSSGISDDRVLRERDGLTLAIELAPTLGDVYARMRAGAINARTPEGQWQFGQALLKASAQLFD
jgi:hypothetical protein